MNKQEALKEIDRLQKYIEKLDEEDIYRVTKSSKLGLSNTIVINGAWAYTTYDEEQQGESYDGCEKSGHKAMMFLADCEGTWYTQKGNKIKGYLYFKKDERGY